MALIKMNLRSNVLSLNTNVTVILPGNPPSTWRNEDPNSYYVQGMKFQTVWLLHGGAGDDSDWVNLTSVMRYAEENQTAVVMGASYDSWYADMVHGKPYFKYFTEELPKVMRAYFPLSDKREDNFVAGLSMGGNGAMRMAIKRPDLYAGALCMSGVAPEIKEIAEPDGFFNKNFTDRKSPFEEIFGDVTKFYGTDEDMYYLAKKNIEDKKPMPKFFFGCGGDDYALPLVENAYKFLKDLGYDIQMEVIPDYGHEWDFWDLYSKKGFYELLPLKRKPIYR